MSNILNHIPDLFLIELDKDYNIVSVNKSVPVISNNQLDPYFKKNLKNNINRPSFKFELQNTSNNLYYNVVIEHNPQGFTIALIDETKYYSLKQSYEFSLIRYRVLFWNSADYIFSLDIIDNTITNANARVIKFLDINRKDLQNNDLLAYIPYDKNPAFYKFVDTVKSIGMGVISDVKIVTYDNKYKYFNGLGIVMDIENENSIYFNFRDITDYKNLQFNIMQNEKLISLGTLTAGIAHEVTQPLMAINLYTEILKNELKKLSIDNQDVNENIKIIENQIRRADDVISNMKNIFRKTTPESTEPADLNQLVLDSLKLITRMFKKHDITIVCNLSKDELVSNVNTSLFMQVIINILNNSLEVLRDFSSKGKIIITSYTKKNNNYLIFTDNGPGIEKKILSNLFDPFFTTKDNIKGTGLGLYISYTVISNFNGTLTAGNSEETQGAVFTICLPVFK